MSPELIGICTVGLALVGFLWKIRRDLNADLENRMGPLNDKIDSLDRTIDSLDRKIDSLGRDHHALAREVSEFRGEVRGRIQRREQSPPMPLEDTAAL